MAKKKVENVTEEQALVNAHAVEAILESEGWAILKEDMERWQERLVTQMLYLDPESREFKELRILGIAIHQFPHMLANYSAQRMQIEKQIMENDNKENLIPKYQDLELPMEE